MLKNRMFLAPALIVLAAVLSGCGMPMNSLKQSLSGAVTQASNSGLPITAGASTGSGLQAPYRVNIQGTGYDTHAVTIPVGTTLKVAWISGKQNAEYNGQFYPYSMLAVYLGVGSNLQPTELVHNGYGGTQAQISSTIDLSHSFTSTCQSGATNCRTQVQILVTQPNDDDACLTPTTYPSYGACPYNHVPDGHPWNGTLVIQTDDTTPISGGSGSSTGGV